MDSYPAARLRDALVAAAAFAAPLALAGFPPGQDLPMHAVAIAGGDVRGFLEPAPLTSSYLTLYAAAKPLALALDAPRAIAVCAAAYAIAFALAARRLYAALGAHPGLALLALPAAFSVVFEYGFLPFAIGYPLILWQWAGAVAVADADAPPGWRTWLGLGLASLVLGATHPLAAALGAGGSGVILATRARRPRAALGAGGLVALGLVPAAVALLQIGAREGVARVPRLLADASLWERFWQAPRLALGEALAASPGWLLGAFPVAARSWLVLSLLVAAAAALAAGGQGRRPAGSARRRYAVEALLVAIAIGFAIAPWTIEEPFVIAVQPRVLPLLWVVALAALRCAPQPRRPRVVGVCLGGGALVAALAWWVAIAPVLGEGRDLQRVIARAEPAAMTLSLIEQAPASELEPAGIWRHAGVHLMALRGGYASHAFFERGSWLPVRRATGVAPPPAPSPGEPRAFSCARHLEGWDQVLIRDLDPGARHDYVADCGGRLSLVASHGRWRLYRARL